MIDLGIVHALFLLVAALGALWLMQVATSDAGIRSGLAWIKLCHRMTLAVVAIVLFANAGETLYNGSAPRPVDFVTQFVLVLVIVFSGWRHTLVTRDRRRSSGSIQATHPSQAR